MEAAEAHCRSRFWWRRVYGARVLTVMNADDEIMPSLLDDQNALVRAEAARWATSYLNDEVIARLYTMSTEDISPWCRFVAKDSLQHMGAIAVDHVSERLSHPDPGVAEDFVELADGLVTAGRVRDLVNLTSDGTPQTRAHAARLLGGLGGTDSSTALRELMVDDSEDVRINAASAAGAAGDWSLAKNLQALLSDSSYRVRRRAAASLLRLGSPGRILLREAALEGAGIGALTARQALGLVIEDGEDTTALESGSSFGENGHIESRETIEPVKRVEVAAGDDVPTTGVEPGQGRGDVFSRPAHLRTGLDEDWFHPRSTTRPTNGTKDPKSLVKRLRRLLDMMVVSESSKRPRASTARTPASSRRSKHAGMTTSTTSECCECTAR